MTGFKLTGISLPKEGFQAQETIKSLDANYVFEVLNGNLAAYRIKEYLSTDACDQIVKNFWESKDRVARLGEGEDGVEGYFLGASHIEKTTQEYLKEASHFENPVKNLFSKTIDPISTFRDSLASGKDKKITVRSSELNNMKAGHSKAVYWSNIGDFLLQPHDDYAQLSDPRQKGFEIQNVKRVMAVNFYAIVPENAGQLKIWNIVPDDKSRAVLNLSHSGFPYPPELLTEFPSMTIPVEAGELCVINGNLVHAVMRGDTTISSKKRLLITCFMGFKNDNELIWWT